MDRTIFMLWRFVPLVFILFVNENIIAFDNTCATLTLIVLNFELAFFIPDDREERRLKEQLRKQHELLLKETVAALLSSVNTLLK